MSWINRSRVRVGSALAALPVVCALLTAPASADAVPDVWFAGARLVFDRPQLRGADIAVATSDPGLTRLLQRLGASLSYGPGQRYVVVTAGDHRTVTMTLGDTRVMAGGITTSAPFAPYAVGPDAYLPLVALARALYLFPAFDGGALTLEPGLGALDVRSENQTTTVTLRGALPLVFRRAAASPDRLTLAFVGLSSSLDPSRVIGAPGLDGIDVTTTGSPRDPVTSVSFAFPPGSQHVVLPSSSANELTIAFAPPGAALRGADIPAQGNASAFAINGEAAAAPPSEGGTPEPAAPTPVAVTAVDLAAAGGDGADLRIAVSGGADFEWHRLNDNRWYVDLRGATLAMAPRDENPNVGGVVGLRVRQFALDPAPIVRVSLTLVSPRHVDVATSPDGLEVRVAAADDLAAARVGVGRIGEGTAYPATESGPLQSTPWKFGPPATQLSPATNPRLIVLDPGHGGSDTGAMHNGLIEKDVTLDIARRLRTVLASRGWTVRMTRDSDTDVFEPNDSAHDELQARCDIANKAGARMFVSIHANSFTTSALSGTTTYYYKPVDLALAQLVHRRLIDALGTKDDGVRKDNFYVIHHTTMPAILVETAFVSNPGDARLLKSPQFLQRIAIAIADGVADYARLSPPAQTSESGG